MFMECSVGSLLISSFGARMFGVVSSSLLRVRVRVVVYSAKILEHQLFPLSVN